MSNLSDLFGGKKTTPTTTPRITTGKTSSLSQLFSGQKPERTFLAPREERKQEAKRLFTDIQERGQIKKPEGPIKIAPRKKPEKGAFDIAKRKISDFLFDPTPVTAKEFFGEVGETLKKTRRTVKEKTKFLLPKEEDVVSKEGGTEITKFGELIIRDKETGEITASVDPIAFVALGAKSARFVKSAFSKIIKEGDATARRTAKKLMGKLVGETREQEIKRLQDAIVDISKKKKPSNLSGLLKPRVKKPVSRFKIADEVVPEKPVSRFKQIEEIKPIAKKITPDKEAKAIAKRFTPSERKSLQEFTDVVFDKTKKFTKEEKDQIFKRGQEVAEKFRLEEVTSTNKLLAKRFGELLDEQRDEFGQLIKRERPAKAKFAKISEELTEAQKISREARPAEIKRAVKKITKPEAPRKITRTETKLLKDKIRNIARGAREGRVEQRVAIKEIQTDMINFIKKNIPVQQRGGLLTALKNVQNPKQATALVERVQGDIIKLDRLGQLAREVGTEKKKLAFIKKIGDFNQTVVSEVKKEVGLDAPIAKATSKQLSEMVTKLKDRLEFKKTKGFKPSKIETIPVERNGAIVPGNKIVKSTVKQPVFTDDFYKGAVPQKPKAVQVIKKDISEASKGIRKGADVIFGAISTRLKNIDPSLKRALRKFEFNNLKAQQAFRKKALPYFEKTNKLNTQDFGELDLALKNGDASKINEIVKKNGMEKEYAEVQELLDDLYTRAKSVGYDLGYRKNYFPRQIKDTDGFLEHFTGRDDWSILDEAIREKQLSLGRYLNNEEKATLINTMIRGYSGGNITLSNTGAMKARKIDFIDKDINKFYADSNSSLLSYINQTNEAIEARKFFGKELSHVDDAAKLKLDDSIGAYTTKLMTEGKLKPSQEKELRDILQARFGEKGTSGIISVIKNLSYIDTMGSPINAITQIGDLAFPLYKNGLPATAKGIFKSIRGTTRLAKEDLGIEQIAQEFTDKTKTAGAVTKVFKIIGLEKMDTIGKNTLIDSSLTKFFKDAKNNNPKLIKELKSVFGDDFSKVLSDLKAEKISEDVKYLAFNRLLDFQPVALSEVPEKYLKGGNGRVFYALKTWTIKMFDVYRNEVFQQIARPETRKQGIKNMVALSAALVTMNATADEIKDLMMGRKTSLKDRAIDNIASLFGINKFTLDTVSREGGGTALAKTIEPVPITQPFEFLGNVIKDITDSRPINEAKTIKSIPGVGKLYYWWFGRGTKSPSKAAPKKKTKSRIPTKKTGKSRFKKSTKSKSRF